MSYSVNSQAIINHDKRLDVPVSKVSRTKLLKIDSF